MDTATEDVLSCSGNVGELNSRSGTTLTEEQQQRIKKNRQLALERRQAKMQCNSQSQHNGNQPCKFNVNVKVSSLRSLYN